MLSVAKLTPGQEAYYERRSRAASTTTTPAAASRPGSGPAAARRTLELDGVVEDGELGTLLRGVDPASERACCGRRCGSGRSRCGRSTSRAGEWREEPKRLAPVSGYDLVFSRPKSVSLLHALADDERGAARDQRGARGGLAGGARLPRGRGLRRAPRPGRRVREHGAGFVAAAYQHRTSRAQDPHLHTHVIVANMARTADGEWRALDGEAILQDLPARRRLPLRGAAAARADAAARGRVDGAGQGDGRARRRAGGGDPRVLDAAAVAASSTWRRSARRASPPPGSPRSRRARRRSRSTCRGCARSGWRARPSTASAAASSTRLVTRSRSLASRSRSIVLASEPARAATALTAKQTTFTMPELVRAVAGSLADGRPRRARCSRWRTSCRASRASSCVEPGEVPGRPARFTTRELLAGRARGARARARRPRRRRADRGPEAAGSRCC